MFRSATSLSSHDAPPAEEDMSEGDIRQFYAFIGAPLASSSLSRQERETPYLLDTVTDDIDRESRTFEEQAISPPRIEDEKLPLSPEEQREPPLPLEPFSTDSKPIVYSHYETALSNPVRQKYSKPPVEFLKPPPHPEGENETKELLGTRADSVATGESKSVAPGPIVSPL
ncbi:hypothetical protein BDD12DRAFT_893494 [Trichophaea hybrida]|nr:hypothetical protein BDD12DRAFT_893494 [Trichophaea hybrida]